MGEALAQTVASGPLLLGLLAAALAGVVSFASPCVIPLVPGYMSYLTGVVGGEMNFEGRYGPEVGRRRLWAVLGAACLFILGFTVVFVLATAAIFGAMSALTLGAQTLMRVGGVVTILMGLVFIGWFPGLQKDVRMAPPRWTTWLGAPLLGAVFALGWTPCLGPTLGAIISISAGTSGMTAVRGVLLIVAYCVGLGVPFLLIAVGGGTAMRGWDWLRRHSHVVRLIGGIAMIVIGILLLSGVWEIFIGWVRQWTVTYGATLI